VLVLAAAWFTTDIGLYAVFGAFSIGLVMPPQPREKDEDPARAGAARNDLVTPTMDGFGRVLVPMFFTYSGLNTRFAVFTNSRVLLFSLAAIVVAVLSKGGACWLGARLAGERGSVPARIGTLMNARGLMQLDRPPRGEDHYPHCARPAYEDS
jgi:Kef-type K+ transport system membrane component KefB